ncbi:MAG: isopentenyl-diphosphate Delta-isomerase [Cyclobacteriaceae bacterium]|nr:MAG: isopentenyl-diphosphate Delta-isomerase [Cyclobacteriaceae bacterium]
MEEVILVDPHDRQTGTMEKLEAHRQGLLHRAFSVVILNSKGELLLQKRAPHKYHCAGLWSNTCCSHPRPCESTAEAARRRLKEEMGIDLEPRFVYSFIYKANLDNHLTEHEVDHVFTGRFDGIPEANPAEVAAWRFVSLNSMYAEVIHNPERFTPWLRLMITHPEFNYLFDRL